MTTFMIVSTVCSLPPARTFRQLISVNTTMIPIASGTLPPPRLGGSTGARKVALPTAYAAIEPGVAIQNRFHA